MSIIKTPITIALTVILLLGIGWFAYDFYNSEKMPRRDLNAYEENLVERASVHFADELEGVEGLYDLVILPIREKRKRNVPEMISEYVSNNTRVTVISMEEIYEVVREKKKELREKEDEDALAKFNEKEYLVEFYQKKKKDGLGVLHLTLNDFKSGKRGQGAGLDVDASLFLASEGKQVELKRYKQYITTKFSFIYFSSWMKSRSPWWRGVFWIFVVIAIPLLIHQAIVKIAKRGSNKQNFYMLLAFIVFNMLLAWFLMGLDVESYASGGILFLAFIFSVIYNYEMCDLIDEWN